MMDILKITEVNDIKVILFTKLIQYTKQKAYYSTWINKKSNAIKLIDEVWLTNDLRGRIDTEGERPRMTFNQAQRHFDELVKTAQNMTFENERKDDKESNC